MSSFVKWVLFSGAWMIGLSFFWPEWPWCSAVSGGSLGFISLAFFDTWRGRREDRELRERFLKSSRR